MTRKKADKKKRKRIFEKRLLAYTAATGAMLAFATRADATIHYTPADHTVSFGDVDVDINGDGTEDFTFWHWADNQHASWSIFGGVDGPGYWLLDSVPYNIGYAANVAKGDPMPPSAGGYGTNNWYNGYLFWQGYNTYYGATYWTGGNFDHNNPGYLGVAFDADPNWVFGWVHIDAVDPNFESFHISGWAYEDNGEGILAGAGETTPIPEPSSIAILAAGAAGISALRRRKKKK